MEVIGKQLHFTHSITAEDKALAARRHRVFGQLLKRFVDGTRWLSDQMGSGVNIVNDKQDFDRLVVEPMDRMWLELTQAEKDYWWVVWRATQIFKGRLI